MNIPQQSETDDPALDGGESLLSLKIVAEIEKGIFEGVFEPGDRINEAALAVRMKMSRGPIREAMRILAGSGLVTMVRNRGVFVREMTASEMVEVSELRAVIFGFAAEAAAENCDAVETRALEQVVENMSAASEANDRDGYYKLNLAFHAMINVQMNNSRMLHLYGKCVHELHLFRRKDFNYLINMRRSNQEHRAIFEAVKSGERQLAGTLAREHIIAGCQRMLRQFSKT